MTIDNIVRKARRDMRNEIVTDLRVHIAVMAAECMQIVDELERDRMRFAIDRLKQAVKEIAAKQ